MSEESPDIEGLKNQLKELESLLLLSDEELKQHLIEDIEEHFSDPNKIALLRKSYEETFKKLEGVLMFLEGLVKAVEGLDRTQIGPEALNRILLNDKA
jgi:hypothetical protein